MDPSRSPQDDVLSQLLDAGEITEEEADQAQRKGETDPDHPSATYHLVAMGALSPRKLIHRLSKKFGVQGVDLSHSRVEEKTLRLIPKETAKEKLVVPVAHDEEGQVLRIATTDPTDWELLEALRFELPYDVEFVVADEYSLARFVGLHYRSEEQTVDDLTANLDEESFRIVDEEEEEEEDVVALDLQERVEQSPVPKFVQGVIADAVRRGASDIHFEFYDDEARVRYRIDGALRTITRPPRHSERAIVSRLKVLAKLNVAERRVPQDGRIRVRIDGRVIDLRVNTLPVVNGENVTLRILDRGALSLDLDTLGIEGRDREILLDKSGRPTGMILVTGPTGSGKTTTLYSLMSLMNTDERKILTVEDPVEYEIFGINQVHVRRAQGLDFASTLKAFLRQDPDVVMVGEVRDRETADIALRAALTGHLVFSTLHTNDSASTITRLIEMDLEPFHVSTAVQAIVAQRLVRTVCDKCAAPARYTEEDLRRLRLDPSEAQKITFMRGRGCDACGETGYKGRTGLYEVLPVTDRLADLILKGENTNRLRHAAVQEGMKTLRAAGIEKIKAGKTTLEEVVRETTL